MKTQFKPLTDEQIQKILDNADAAIEMLEKIMYEYDFNNLMDGDIMMRCGESK